MSAPPSGPRSWCGSSPRCTAKVSTRVLELACGPEPLAGESLLARLADDELVASLLLLHGLHPESLQARVERALSSLQRSLGSGDVRLLDVDEETGTVRVRLLVGGAGSVPASLEQLVRRTIEDAAPEVGAIEVERPLPSTPVRFGAPAGSQAAAPEELVATRPSPSLPSRKASS